MSGDNRSLLVLALKAYGNKCIWCGSVLVKQNIYKKLSGQDKAKVRMATVDHILPKSYGGTDHINNLRPSCSDCNGVRGSGWKPEEADVFPSCPLLIELEHKRPELKLKLSFPTSIKWIEKWKHRLMYRISPHKCQQLKDGERWTAYKEER